MFKRVSIFSGNANLSLTQEICQVLEFPLGKSRVSRFSDGETFCVIQENVRGVDTYIVQPTCSPVNDNVMELLIMVDALRRASAGSITAVIPYYGYARQDRKVAPRTPITSKLVADLIVAAGVNRIVALDLHAGQIQGFFNIPLDELNALFTMTAHFKHERLENYVVVAPDVGDEKRARDVAARLDMPLAIIEKRRLGNTGRTEAMNVIGEVEGRNVLVIDDEIDTAGTITEAVRILRERGARDAIIACYHGLFTGPAIERLTAAGVREIVVTDSIPIPEAKRLPNMTILPVAPLLGDAIGRIHSGQSVGALFQ